MGREDTSAQSTLPHWIVWNQLPHQNRNAVNECANFALDYCPISFQFYNQYSSNTFCFCFFFFFFYFKCKFIQSKGLLWPKYIESDYSWANTTWLLFMKVIVRGYIRNEPMMSMHNASSSIRRDEFRMQFPWLILNFVSRTRGVTIDCTEAPSVSPKRNLTVYVFTTNGNFLYHLS